MQSASQLVEKPLFGEKAFSFAGGVRGGKRRSAAGGGKSEAVSRKRHGLQAKVACKP